MNVSRERIPVTILTGFLGAGKTTLLKRILDDPEGVRFGVLVNDFGAINIDADLVAEASADQVALENGCVCCTIRDDLVEAIGGLLAREPAPERIVVEASGVSRPLPIADALEAPTLAERVALDGIFCLVDGAGFSELDFAATELAIDQVSGADVVLLNKCDIAPEDALGAVEATLKGPMPQLRILRTTNADVPRRVLFGLERPGPAAQREGGAHDHDHHADHDHDHAEAFQTWHWTSEGALDARRLRTALKSLPGEVMRAKGIFCGEDLGRLVFQQVGRRSRLSREDGPAPARNALVVIGRKGALDPDALTDALNAARRDD